MDNEAKEVSGRNRILAVVASIALLVAACGGGGEVTISETATDPDPTVAPTVAPTTPPEPEPTAEPTAAPEPTPAPEPTATTEPATRSEPGESVYAGHLAAGECFDLDADGRPGPAVDCQDRHEQEIIALSDDVFADVAAYPGDEALHTQAWDDLCVGESAAFVNDDVDLVPHILWTWVPDVVDWEAGDRRVLCTAVGESDDGTKIGTAAGGTMSSDDYVVSRVLWDGNTSWGLTSEFTPDGEQAMITFDEYTLPKVAPQATAGGLLFAAAGSGDAGIGTKLWLYEFADQATSEFDAVLAGWQKASLQVSLAQQTLVFAARETEDDDWDIYAVDESQQPVALTDNPGDDRWPFVTPDGTQIVFHSSGDLWIMNLDGSDPRQLTDGPANDWESAVSPDGTMIAFSSDRAGADDIWLMEIDGGEPVNLTNHPGNDTWPFWSPDGSKIYFQTDRLGPIAHLMMMEVDGSNQSWYSQVITSHGTVIGSDQAQALLAVLPTAAELVAGGGYELVEADPTIYDDVFGRFATSDQRLEIDLPAGWQVAEGTAGLAQIVSAPDIDEYFTEWETDGITATVAEADSLADWQNFVDGLGLGPTSCTEVADPTPSPYGGAGTDRTYSCPEGDDKATVRMIEEYDESTGIGLLIEVQYDGVDQLDFVDIDIAEWVLTSAVWN